MHRNQHSSGGNIHCRGKLQEIFAILTMAANENRNGERKTIPRASFYFRLLAMQNLTPLKSILACFPAPFGPNKTHKAGVLTVF